MFGPRALALSGIPPSGQGSPTMRCIVPGQRWGAGGSAGIGHPPWFPPTRYGGPRMRRGGPNAHRSMLPPMGPMRMPDGSRKISKSGEELSREK
jgi:hypothetical protein